MPERTILVVEDDPDDEALILAALAQHGGGVTVRLAHDGVEAVGVLEGARSGSELPDLVLLDLGLPRLGGVGVLERIRSDERLRLIPVVVFTSSADPLDRAKAYAAGAVGYIQKPFRFQDFSEAVRVLVQYWLELNEPPPPRRSSGEPVAEAS